MYLKGDVMKENCNGEKPMKIGSIMYIRPHMYRDDFHWHRATHLLSLQSSHTLLSTDRTDRT